MIPVFALRVAGNVQNVKYGINQWRSQNFEKVTHNEGRLLLGHWLDMVYLPPPPPPPPGGIL